MSRPARKSTLNTAAPEPAAPASTIGVPRAMAKLYGHPKFHQYLQEASELHSRKSRDYGDATDPFANLKMSAEFGVEPWRGALVRLGDKIARLQTFCRTGELQNEGVVDSLMDIAVYAVIIRVLLEEEWEADDLVVLQREGDGRG
jgi:hypothetical protein